MNGLLVINKEKDYTSRDVVNIISKTFNMANVGHTGTLDPMATGVLVIALGKSLKLIEFLTRDRKEYIVEVKMGILTDTLDITGNIIKEDKLIDINKSKLKEILNSFIGESIQEVPIYSAIKIKGKRLYDYARNNEVIELPKRKIEIYNIELLDLNKDIFSFKVGVSKGTYIRSLVRDIGNKLGISCTMKELNRTKEGIFSIENSYTLDEIKNNKYKLINMYDSLSNYKMVEVDDFIENKILNGRILENRYNDDLIVFINKNKDVLGIYEVYSKDNTKIKPRKVFK